MKGRKEGLSRKREEPRVEGDETSAIKQPRNYGVDLLRIFAMLGIVLVHTLGVGGILSNLIPGSIGYRLSWLLYTIACCSVNCYALISGYVCYGRKFSYNKIITLWFQVVFCTLFVTGAFQIFHPESLSELSWFAAVMPVTYQQYWYFTAYFCMFFFIPFFNRLLDALTQKQASVLALSIVLLLSVFPTFCRADLFRISNGYSVLWLSALYILGAYIKKYHVAQRVSPVYAAILFLICILVTWGYKLLVDAGTLTPIAFMQTGDDLLNYNAYPMLFAGIALLLFFVNLKLNYYPRLIKLILGLAPSSFSVYLLHTQSMVWFYFIVDRFIWCASLRVWKLIPVVFAITVGIYLCCSGIDLVRRGLFRILRVRTLSVKLETVFSRLFGMIVGKLSQDPVAEEEEQNVAGLPYALSRDPIAEAEEQKATGVPHNL